MQRWTAEIMTYSFQLVNVPAKKVLMEDIMGRMYEHIDDPKVRDDEPMTTMKMDEFLADMDTIVNPDENND